MRKCYYHTYSYSTMIGERVTIDSLNWHLQHDAMPRPQDFSDDGITGDDKDAYAGLKLDIAICDRIR